MRVQLPLDHIASLPLTQGACKAQAGELQRNEMLPRKQ